MFGRAELCLGGNLQQMIERLRRLEEPLAQLYAAEMLLSIIHLHERRILHRDIKEPVFNKDWTHVCETLELGNSEGTWAQAIPRCTKNMHPSRWECSRVGRGVWLSSALVVPFVDGMGAMFRCSWKANVLKYFGGIQKHVPRSYRDAPRTCILQGGVQRGEGCGVSFSDMFVLFFSLTA